MPEAHSSRSWCWDAKNGPHCTQLLPMVKQILPSSYSQQVSLLSHTCAHPSYAHVSAQSWPTYQSTIALSWSAMASQSWEPRPPLSLQPCAPVIITMVKTTMIKHAFQLMMMASTHLTSSFFSILSPAACSLLLWYWLSCLRKLAPFAGPQYHIVQCVLELARLSLDAALCICWLYTAMDPSIIVCSCTEHQITAHLIMLAKRLPYLLADMLAYVRMHALSAKRCHGAVSHALQRYSHQDLWWQDLSLW